MEAVNRIHRLWPTAAALIALVLLWLGERVMAAAEGPRTALGASAAALLGAALAMRLKEHLAAGPDKKRVAFRLFLSTLGVVLALALYALLAFGLSGDGAKNTRAIVWGIFPVLLTCSTFTLVAIELAVLPVAFNPRYEQLRVDQASQRGLGLALALSVLVFGNYLANRHDSKADLTYGQKAAPGEQTRRVVRDLNQDIKVRLFFPKSNEVAEQIEPYFDALVALSPKISVEQHDIALAGQVAKDAGVTENGWVAVSYDKANEKIRIGEKLSGARSAIRKLDASVIGAIIKVTQQKKTAYFTAGHEERTATPDKDDTREPMKLLKQLLENNQFTTKPLGVAEGLADKLPHDAAMILILGPEKPFTQAEVDAVLAGMDQGARLLIALEGEREGEALAPLLAGLGLSFDKTILVNERSNVPFTRTDADKTSIWSNRFSSHESVTTMTRNQKLATVFDRSGSLTKLEKSPDKTKVELVLTTMDDTFADVNNNLVFDKDVDKKGSFGLAAVVTRTATSGKKSDEGRAFVITDVDFVADRLIKFEGNINLLADIVYWLKNVEEPVIPQISEQDVQIVHKKDEDALLFYATTLGVPGAVLLFGFFGSRRRRMS